MQLEKKKKKELQAPIPIKVIGKLPMDLGLERCPKGALMKRDMLMACGGGKSNISNFW